LQWADLPSLELLQLMASGRVSHSSNIKKTPAASRINDLY